jgi:hypothetical protein
LSAYFGVSVNELDQLAEEGAISVVHVGGINGIKIYGVLDDIKECWKMILTLRKAQKERESTA